VSNGSIKMSGVGFKSFGGIISEKKGFEEWRC